MGVMHIPAIPIRHHVRLHSRKLRPFWAIVTSASSTSRVTISCLAWETPALA